MQNFRSKLRSIYLIPFLLLISGQSHSATLLMVESDDCPYCERFNQEIAPAYSKTEEGKTAPLERFQLGSVWPEKYQLVKTPTVTPTFVLIDNGKEIDRLTGYPGDQHFWFLLGQMLNQLQKLTVESK